jgi:hypothetical protein
MNREKCCHKTVISHCDDCPYAPVNKCSCLTCVSRRAALTAAPPAPVREVEGLVKRLRWRGEHTSDQKATTPTLCREAADALTSLSARLASETDRAETAIESLNEARDECATASARVEALEKALEPFLRSLDMQESEWRIQDRPELQDTDPLAYAMIGDARRARAALNNGAGS